MVNPRLCRGDSQSLTFPGAYAKTPFCEPLKVRRREFVITDAASLNHTRWECKYHVVFIPKYRRKALFVELRRNLGSVFRDLAEQRESRIEEGHLLPDHVHMLISIPPKHAVPSVVGFIKGKSAIHIARTFVGKRRNFTGESFWARGYYVSTVGRDEATIRQYIQNQEAEDKRVDQLHLWQKGQ